MAIHRVSEALHTASLKPGRSLFLAETAKHMPLDH